MAKVYVRNGNLDVISGGRTLLRGIIHPESLQHLQVGEYQREILKLPDPQSLKLAYAQGTVQDIKLGV